ncbi:MAG TPA: hypothetical protein VHB46_11245 [Burkholderiales bacterium]|nr:hypothetical protein [Burkholderiales bacterium]
MKKLFLAIAGLSLSAAVPAQDFLQQWRDSAAKGMAEFRDGHKATIEAGGWRFVGGTRSIEDVPISDVFVKSVKTEGGSVRSASFLNVLYVAVPESNVPEYRSTKMLVWIDCASGGYEQRILERYPTVDGTGIPGSREVERQESTLNGFPGADAHTYEKPMLAAVCTTKS